MGILTPQDLEKLSQTPEKPGPFYYVCCVCKGEFITGQATAEPPPGYRWGGWFCRGCLAEGERLAFEGTMVDQFTKQIVNHQSETDKIVFNRNGEPVAMNGC